MPTLFSLSNNNKIIGHNSNTKPLFICVLISIGFVLLDGISLSSLPRLGISYGGIRISLFSLILIRGAILFLWSVIIGGSIIYRSQRSEPSTHRTNGIIQFSIWSLVGLNFLIFGLEIYGFFIEPMKITVSRIEVEVPGLKQSVRIVQLSDIHLEFTTRRERSIPVLVDSLNPDMIVLTGDYLNESYKYNKIAQQDLRDLIGQLHAPLGIYAVDGNVESQLRMNNLFSGLDVRLLDNEVVQIPQLGEHFLLVGLDYNNWYKSEVILEDLMASVNPDDFTLLIYHTPDLAYAAENLGVDLYLTGHTHGGQFRLPFFGAVIIDSRFYKSFEEGLYQLDNTELYVSRGLGMAGGAAPRIRFLAPPEVVVVDLIPRSLLGDQ